MSVSMAVKGDGFSIVAADTRSTNCQTGGVKDDIEKVFKYEHGWAALNGGVAATVDFFKSRINSRKIETRKQIYDSWLRSVKDTIDRAALLGVAGTDWRVNTSKAYVSIGLEINVLDFEYGRRKLTSGKVIFSPPKDTRRIKALVAKYSVEPASLGDAIYIMACFLHELARLTKWVSDTLDAGITLMLDDELLFLHLKADTKAIKQAYQDKTLDELMIVKKYQPPIL